MGLRNLPTKEAAPLAQLVTCHPGHVSSMALSCGAGADIALLSFAAGESVSEEEYFGDTLYYVVEGRAIIALPNARVPIEVGEVFMVPAHVLHAVEGTGNGAFKLLQLTMPE